MIMYQTRAAGQSSHHSRNVHWKCSPKNHLLFPYLHSSVINPTEFKVPPYIRKDRTLGSLSSSPKSSQSWGTTEQTAAERAALGAAKMHWGVLAPTAGWDWPGLHGCVVTSKGPRAQDKPAHPAPAQLCYSHMVQSWYWSPVNATQERPKGLSLARLFTVTFLVFMSVGCYEIQPSFHLSHRNEIYPLCKPQSL